MRTKSGRGDVLLVCMVLFLVVFGLAVLYSTGSYNGSVRFGDAFYYMKKQFFALALGMLAMYLISCMDYHIFEKYAIATYLISLALSTLVLFAGNAYNGSRRWLSLGPLSFQPSEFAKLAVILFLARMVGRQKKKRNSFLNLVFVIALVLPIVALVGTNNLSTAIIILGIAVIVVFVSDKRYMQFVWIAAAGAGMMALFLGMESYRLERIAIWKNPEAYEKGYQTIQGLYAIGSGGLFGRGFGESIQKLGFVPEAQNDMIFFNHLRRTWICRCHDPDACFSDADLEVYGDRCTCTGSFRVTDRGGSHGAHRDPGDFKCSRCDKYDSEYRDHTSVYQLWRYFRFVSARRWGWFWQSAGGKARKKCI